MKEYTIVVGVGMMGSSIGAMSALAGHKTVFIDVNLEAASNGMERARQAIDVRRQNGLNTAEEAERAVTLLEASDDIERYAEKTRIVIEAIAEDLQAKQNLFSALDCIFPPEVPICSNTSGLRITDISSRCRHPERTMTTHFWLPAHLVPLVEVVMHERSDEKIAHWVYGELEQWKKMPVLVKRDEPGQLANRIFQAIIREAVDIVASGLASPEDVDRAIGYGMGIRFPEWGPLLHLDAVGLKLGLAVQDTVLPNTCTNKESGQYLQELVKNGNLGAATGKGFYDWSEKNLEQKIFNRDRFIIEAVKIMETLKQEKENEREYS